MQGTCLCGSLKSWSWCSSDWERASLSPPAPITLEETPVIYLTILVTLFLFGYLLVALLRPEWF